MTAIEHLPPHNTDAEEAVLGSCLMDPDAIHTLRGDLDPADFFRGHNGTIYRALLSLASAGTPVDFATVCDALTRQGEFDETGGYDYLYRLVRTVPTAVHAGYYAAIVRRTAIKRRLIEAAGKIAAVGYDDSLEAEDSISRANELLAAVQRTLGAIDLYSPEAQASLLVDMAGRLGEGEPPGIHTGFVKLDRETGGLRPGGLYVIGAPTGVGKTAWMGSTALSISRRSEGTRRQLFATCEVTAHELVKRFAAAHIGRDWNAVERDLARPGEYPNAQREVHDAAGKIAESGITVFHRGRMTVDAIRSRASRMASDGGLDVLYVDYLQRLTCDGKRGENREREVSSMAQGLKSLAVDLSVPVVVAAQFSRSVEYRDCKEPRLSDYRESGGIENEADVAMGLYRPHRWDETQSKTEAWLHIMKNRHGAGDSKEGLVWMPETTRYGSAAMGRE